MLGRARWRRNDLRRGTPKGPRPTNETVTLMATKAKAAVAAPEPREDTPADGPLMDSMSASIRKMILRGRERGYVTYDEINAALPTEQTSSEQIEDTLALLSEQGITVVENEEPEEAEKAAPAAEPAAAAAEIGRAHV